MFLTKEEKAAIKAMYEFWGANKKMPQRFRNQAAEDFAESWALKINIMKPIMIHPDTRKKDKTRSRSLAEIISDFILDVDQVEERSQEYPIENAEKAFREQQKRKQHERSIVYQSEHDRDNGQLGEDYRTPPYSIEEYAFNTWNPVELEIFNDDNAYTVDEMREGLLRVKKFREFYVATYSDEMPENGRSREEVEKAIRQLDITRVKECEICGGAFYAHYRGRIHCDIQKYPGSNKSACEVIAHRKRNSTQNNSIIL